MISPIEAELAALDLGDQRLNRRAGDVLRRFLDAPSVSPTAALHGWAEMVGAYRLFDHPECTEDAILQAHRQAVLQRVRQHPRILLIQDTTELDYTTKKGQTGRGPLASAERQGYFVHTQWAVTPERLPLGAWTSHIFARDPEVGVAPDRKAKPIEDKESFRWLEGYRQACELAEQAPSSQIISCSDREGDIYEVFAEWHERLEHSRPAAQWLIRCCQDRALLPHAQELESTTPAGPATRLVEAVSQSPVIGGIWFEITTKEQFKSVKGSKHRVLRQGRQVRQDIRVGTVRLRPPHRPGSSLPAVSLGVVMATEPNPPPGQDPIHWVLLTSLPVETLDQALDILRLYLARWEIEVFHRVLKTGCKVEQLQFKNDFRIKPVLALYIIVSWRILYLTKLGRECPDLPCDVVFTEEEWKSICVIDRGHDSLAKKPSLRELILIIAKYGGFAGRRSDGFPGPEVMWRGLEALRCFAIAWQSFGRPSG